MHARPAKYKALCSQLIRGVICNRGFFEMALRFPLAAFGILILFGISVNVYAAYKGLELSQNTERLWLFTLSYITALTVEVDRKLMRFSAPFEFSAFVFFAWPVIVPYYLFKTRGWAGLGWAVAFMVATLLPDLAALAANTILWR